MTLDTVKATSNNVVTSAGARFYFVVAVRSGATRGDTVALQIPKTKVQFSDGGWPPSTIGPLGSNTLTTGTATAVALTAGTTPSVFGQSLTFQATVTQTTGASSGSSVGATGSVTFTDGVGGSALCSTVALNASGQASCTTASLAVGSHQIIASYAGAGNFGSPPAKNALR